MIKLRIPNHKWKRIPKGKRQGVRDYLRECERVMWEEFEDHHTELMMFGTTFVGGKRVGYDHPKSFDKYGASPAQEALRDAKALGAE